MLVFSFSRRSSGLPLSAGVKAPDARAVLLATTHAKPSQHRHQQPGFASFKEPLLQNERQPQQEEQVQQPQLEAEHRSVSSGAATDEQAEGASMRTETLRAKCVAAFGAAIENEKTKVAAFFSRGGKAAVAAPQQHQLYRQSRCSRKIQHNTRCLYGVPSRAAKLQ